MREVKGLVSISIPFCNSESFLSEAVESVLLQTYSRWELFLVDDGSADQSAKIAQEYADRFPGQIRYLEHPGHRNCGVTHTRNLGARESRGEYLAFLDSDDVWLPHKLQLQVELMEAQPEAGLIYGPSEYWYESNAAQGEQPRNRIAVVAPGERLYTPPVLLTSTYPLGTYGAPCPSSFLLRRSAFELVGGFVESFNPRTFQLFEDTAFLSKVYLTVPVFVTNRCSDRYRCHPLSIWHRTIGTSREEAERKYYFHWLQQHLSERGITDSKILRAVRRQSWAYWLPLPVRASKLLRRIGDRLL